MWSCGDSKSPSLSGLTEIKTEKPARSVWVQNFGSLTDLNVSLNKKYKPPKTLVSHGYIAYTMFKGHIVECKTLLVKKNIGGSQIKKLGFIARSGVVRIGPKDKTTGKLMSATACARSIIEHINCTLMKDKSKRKRSTVSGLLFFGFKSKTVCFTNKIHV